MKARNVFNFWQDVVNKKGSFQKIRSPAEFPFDYSLFSYAHYLPQEVAYGSGEKSKLGG